MSEQMDLFLNSDATASQDLIHRLDSQIDNLLECDQKIADMELMLKELKALRHKLRTNVIPELMNEAGVTLLERNGRKISMTEYVSGTLPKDEKEKVAAIKWLDENDGGGIIKSDVVVSFGRQDYDKAKELRHFLETDPYNIYQPELKETVHPQTYQAWVRERIANGDPIDTEALGVSIGQIVKVQS